MDWIVPHPQTILEILQILEILIRHKGGKKEQNLQNSQNQSLC